jgi:hypothetical protein
LTEHGTLLLQFHSLAAIMRGGQWNSLRHGHFAYYSLTALSTLLARVGLTPVTAWSFPLYGGTVLVAARRGALPDGSITAMLAQEAALGVSDPQRVGALQARAGRDARALRQWLRAEAAAGRRVYGYGAASRAVALLNLAQLPEGLLLGVADASPAKHGRRLPGTTIAVLSPDELVAAGPDHVLLLPDLLAEVQAALPALAGRWRVEPAGDPFARISP